MRHSTSATVRVAAIAGVLAGAAWICAGCGTGGAAKGAVDSATKAEKSAVDTANDAIKIVQQTAMRVQNVPQLVYDMANAILNANSQSSWGTPEMVVVTDTEYVILYPTSAAERQRNGGVPRMVLIKRDQQTDPTRG